MRSSPAHRLPALLSIGPIPGGQFDGTHLTKGEPMTRSLLAVSALVLLSACQSPQAKQDGHHRPIQDQVILDGGWHWKPAISGSTGQTDPAPPASLLLTGVTANQVSGYQLATALMWLQPGSLNSLDTSTLDPTKATNLLSATSPPTPVPADGELPVYGRTGYCRIVVHVTGTGSGHPPFNEYYAYEWQVPTLVMPTPPPYPKIPFFFYL
jgi:hypothetical protein